MFMFWIFAVLLTLSACGVVLFRNPIHSALSLIFNMITIAALFASLNAHFLAAVQIIVYAGAVMVLVIFVLMLLNAKEEDSKDHSPLLVGLATLVVIMLVVMFAPRLFSAFLVLPDGTSAFAGTMKDIGLLLYTRYVLPFEAASVLIMVAVAGAVMLSKRRYR